MCSFKCTKLPVSHWLGKRSCKPTFPGNWERNQPGFQFVNRSLWPTETVLLRIPRESDMVEAKWTLGTLRDHWGTQTYPNKGDWVRFDVSGLGVQGVWEGSLSGALVSGETTLACDVWAWLRWLPTASHTEVLFIWCCMEKQYSGHWGNDLHVMYECKLYWLPIAPMAHPGLPPCWFTRDMTRHQLGCAWVPSISLLFHSKRLLCQISLILQSLWDQWDPVRPPSSCQPLQVKVKVFFLPDN